MSYNSKKTIASITVGVLLAVIYTVYALGQNAPALSDVKSWAVTMLTFIGIGAAAVIVIQILFHIALAISISVKERDEKTVKRVLNATMLEDEREKAVSQRAAHIGYGLIGVGFCAALIALAAGVAVVPALHIIFGACFLGSLAEAAVSVCLFELGDM